ncbi:GWxTD domain-containing protein [bacterium]|nr:GWxTD domain-containing protein [bacterium]
MNRFLALLFLVLLAMTASAQDATTLRMNIDFASFKYDDQTSYVEMYYSFPRSAIQYTLRNNVYNGSAVVHTIIRREDKEEDPVLKNWRVPISLNDTTGLKEKTLIGRVNYLLEPGRYRITVITRDEAQPLESDSVEVRYEVRQFGSKNLKFSDIELASSIQKAENDPANIFYKNTLEVIPNPTLLYGKPMPNVMYYAELYNVKHDDFLVKSEIVSSYGKTMVSKARERQGKHASRVEVGSLNLSTLPSGVYTLILSYGDTSGTFLESQSKPFYVFNPDIPIDTAAITQIADQIAAEFAAMSESELDEQFAMGLYVATSDEKNIWSSLTGAEPKKKFLTKFWRSRDTDPVTPQNEFFSEYQQRVAIANEQFRSAFRKGWRSDRGRVYIVYGPPDYIERMSSESDMKPHEIWRYDYIEGGVEFIFVDKGGFNNYELVHSTKRNEINNPDWERSAGTY